VQRRIGKVSSSENSVQGSAEKKPLSSKSRIGHMYQTATSLTNQR
jgi:hypothetical protein